MHFRYDSDADALYVRLRDYHGKVRSTRIDDRRIIDYSDEAGVPVGVEFLFVKDGIDLEGIPEAEQVRELLTMLGKLGTPGPVKERA